MKFEEIKDEIKTIAEIANSVPDAFKERCFEILLENLLASTAPETKKPVQGPPPAAAPVQQQETQTPSSENGASIPTPSQIKVFMGKTGVTVAELSKVLMSLLSGYKLNRFSWLEMHGKSSWESIC